VRPDPGGLDLFDLAGRRAKVIAGCSSRSHTSWCAGIVRRPAAGAVQPTTSGRSPALPRAGARIVPGQMCLVVEACGFVTYVTRQRANPRRRLGRSYFSVGHRQAVTG
jgi:hypothetical protein